jgi:hypothetical protein
VAESAQRFDDRVLRLGLARIDDVVDFSDVAEVRMILLALVIGGDPAVVLIGIAVELAIAEIASEQAELPHVIGDVFADVADGAVGADDDFLIFFGIRPERTSTSWRNLMASSPVPHLSLAPSFGAEVARLRRRITQQPLFLPSVSK